MKYLFLPLPILFILTFFNALCTQAQTIAITENGGKITGQYRTPDKSENEAMLFDKNLNTKYFLYNKPGYWVQYESISPVIVNQYSISSANDLQERDPKTWTIQASEDGKAWKIIDQQINQTFNGRKTTRTYKIKNASSYKFYKLNILENNGAPGTQLSEWTLF